MVRKTRGKTRTPVVLFNFDEERTRFDGITLLLLMLPAKCWGYAGILLHAGVYRIIRIIDLPRVNSTEFLPPPLSLSLGRGKFKESKLVLFFRLKNSKVIGPTAKSKGR